jgi:hypothetical protein
MKPEPRWNPPTQDDIRNRIEDLVSSLLILDGMTKRGGALPDEYRERELPAIKRFAGRVLDALEKGERARQPWDHTSKEPRDG